MRARRDELLKNEPEKPALQYFRINDPTIQALQEILKDAPKCLLLERDELIGMLSQWEMNGHEMDRSFYLEAHTGLRAYRGARVGRGPFFLPILCLSLFGGIQPIKLVQYLRDPKTNLSHDGAIQRFQFLVYPNPMNNYTYTDQSENTEAKNRFFAILEKLADTKDFQEFGAVLDEYHKIPFFTFDNEAQALFKDWLYEINPEIHAKREQNQGFVTDPTCIF